MIWHHPISDVKFISIGTFVLRVIQPLTYTTKCLIRSYLGVYYFSALLFTLHSLLDVTMKSMDFKNCSKKKSPHHTKKEWEYIFTKYSVPMCFCCNSSYFWPVEDIQEKKLKLGRQPSYHAFHTILSPYCTSMFFYLERFKTRLKDSLWSS